MKPLTAFFLAIILSLTASLNVMAQTAESIWLAAQTTSYKTEETVLVTVNAVSSTPIQGFTFQIRYDPECLKPVNASSTIPGMNALPLPQVAGLVDGSYASTTPQTVNGVLAEVRFTALKGCQTNLTLESAALAIRNQSGFAAPLAGVTLGENSVALTIDSAKGEAQPYQPLDGAVLPLEPTEAEQPLIPTWAVAAAIALALALAVVLVFVALRLLGTGSKKRKPAAGSKTAKPSGAPRLQVQRGAQAGQVFILNKLPCVIGRSPDCDVRLDDPQVTAQHAQIFFNNNGYYLMDLGGGTFLNGQVLKRGSVLLKPGDVVRLGKGALLVFGA